MEKYPQLSTVIDRLLEIYLLVSAGQHEPCPIQGISDQVTLGNADDVNFMEVESEVGKFLANSGRLVSTR